MYVGLSYRILTICRQRLLKFMQEIATSTDYETHGGQDTGNCARKQLSFSYLHLFIKCSEFSEFCKAQIARNVAGIFC